MLGRGRVSIDDSWTAAEPDESSTSTLSCAGKEETYEMGRRRFGSFDLDEALCADGLVAASRSVDVGGIVLQGLERMGRTSTQAWRVSKAITGPCPSIRRRRGSTHEEASERSYENRRRSSSVSLEIGLMT